MKLHSTQRKHSAVARASQSAGRSDYRGWSGGSAALLAENPHINTRLQPGVSRAQRRRAVLTACRPHEKPLKRFPASTHHHTGLKPGVNERQMVQTASRQSKILPAVLAKSPSSISQTLSANLDICGTVSHESAATISATPSRKFTIPIYETPLHISFVARTPHLETPCRTIGNSNGESQRDSGSKPKVARHELPWVSASHVNNPNGVAARRRKRGTTPLGLKLLTATTQGSSCLVTLGWVTQSRWDCRSQIIFHDRTRHRPGDGCQAQPHTGFGPGLVALENLGMLPP